MFMGKILRERVEKFQRGQRYVDDVAGLHSPTAVC